jgi:exonuclease V gamma subunit
MKLPHSYASEWQSLFHEPWSDDTIRGDAQIITESIKQKYEQCPEPEQALQQETSSVASREFTLDALAAGHANPLAYYYQTSLGLSHWGTKDGVDDREPFTLNGLQAYSIKERLFEAWSIGDDLVGEDLNSDTLSADIEGDHNSGLDVVFEHLIAEGALARQPLAGMHFNALAQDASALRTHMFASGRPVRLRIQSMAVEGSDVHISGDLYYTGHGQIELSLSKRVGRNFFGVWLKHVVWNYYLHHTKPKLSALGETHYISATQHITLPALSEETSVIYLQELLTYYDEVLVAPKLFLPETAYVQLFGKESEIKTTFSGGFNQGGESALLFWQRACYFSGLNHDPSDIPDMENLVPMAQISRHCDPDHGSRKKKQPSDPAREPSELNRWISVEKLK